jgi:hypothetical protein
MKTYLKNLIELDKAPHQLTPGTRVVLRLLRELDSRKGIDVFESLDDEIADELLRIMCGIAATELDRSRLARDAKPRENHPHGVFSEAGMREKALDYVSELYIESPIDKVMERRGLLVAVIDHLFHG